MDSIARQQSDLGAILRRRRKAKALTQTNVSELTSLRQSTLPRLEREGRGTIDTLYKILAALDLEIVIRDRTRAPDSIADIFE